MKKALTVLAALGLAMTAWLLPAAAFAEPVSVIIYPSGARITEHQTVDLAKENDRLRADLFLPLSADTDSLTIEVPEKGRYAISSVQVDMEDMPESKELTALKDRLEVLSAKKAGLESRIKSNRTYIAFWENMGKNMPEKTESVDQVAQSMKTGLTAAYDEIYQHEQTLKEVNDQVKKLQEEINDLTGRAEKRWRVTVYLKGADRASAGAEKIGLDYSYRTPSCSWTPSYTLNARPDASSIDFSWFADIYQNTGTDWQNVAVTVATAQAYTQPEPPETGDWIIRPAPEAVPMRKMARDAMAPQANAEAQMFAAGEAPRRQTQYLYDTYDLGRHFIPAGQNRRVAIRQQNWKADFKYMIRPHEAAEAFLTANVNMAPEAFLPLPEGNAEFFVDGAFIADRMFAMPDAQQDLFFGTDPGISVKLDLLEKESGEKGLFAGKKSFKWTWAVTVENHTAHPADILMEAAYPQIRDERIKLETEFKNIQPKKEDHLLKWTFDVAPRGKTKIQYGFSITYPDDMKVTFGGR